ncbi:hypothetical protein, partial [uncultured Halomonas sp.]|uniref:hypothetical protein n=1 Tax=uncultured Halomonas sp. TaxID=173971 RepID=UPI0026368533
MSAALAMMQRSSGVDYQRMAIGRLKELARQEHSEHTDEAARAYVARLLEMAAEWLTDYRHANTGHHPFSGAAMAGEQPEGSTQASEPLLIAYMRTERERAHHLGALQQLVAALQRLSISERQLIAVLIQARKLHPRRSGSDWAAGYDQIAAGLGRYVQQLGWPPGAAMVAGKPLFKDGKAITNAATQARASLILQAKAGVL